MSRNYHNTPNKTHLSLGSIPPVSVIVPVYNVEEYLPKCLDSLVNQTLKDIEIIIVNDGSTDNSQAIIDKYHQKHPNVIKPFIKENTGVADTRNFGISKAKGEFIGFVDSDDYVSTDMYEKLVKRAISTGSDVTVCHYERVNEQTGQAGIPNLIDKNSFGFSVMEKPVIILDSRPFLWNKIFKRSLFAEYGFNLPPLKLSEDTAMVYPILLTANKVEFVDEPLYHYREGRTDSIVNTVDYRFFDLFKAFDIILDFYREKGALESCSDALAEQFRILLFIRLRTLKNIKDRRFARDFIKSTYRYLDQNFKGWKHNPYYRKKPEYNKNHGLNRFIFNNGLIFNAYLCLPIRIRSKEYGSTMKQRIVSLLKDSRLGGLAFWLLGKSGRQARNFAYYYENGDILDNHIFYAAFRGDDFTGNPYAIFQYLYNHPDMKDLRHVILIKDKENPRVLPLLNDERIIIVHPSDYKKYAKYAETSKYLMVDTSLSPYYIKKSGQVFVHTWHSTLLKSLGTHTDFVWETHNMAKSLLDSDYFVSPNRFTSEILFEAYYCDTLYQGKILELGYPRNDLLINADKEEVRRMLNIPDGKKLVLYAPTWRGTVTKPVKNVDIFIKHYERIKSGLGDEYAVLIKFHHMSQRYLTPAQMKYVAPFHIETNLLLAATDILITDYSGIFFDYLITRNPIILFPFDKDEYLSHRGGSKDFYLDLNDIPASICHTSDEIVDTIRGIDVIAQEKAEYYEEFAKLYVGNDDGHASERVCDVVFRGKSALSTYSLPKQGKQNMLIMMDDLNDLRITSRLLDFLNHVDYEKYNVSVWLNSVYTNRKVQLKINPQVKLFYKSACFIYLNYDEWKKVKRLSNKGYAFCPPMLHDFSLRNMRRSFADIRFDIAVYYSGRSDLYSMLCLQGVDAEEKVAYWHGEKPLSTLRCYDEIVKAVAKELPLDEMVEKTISRDSFESRFTRQS